MTNNTLDSLFDFGKTEAEKLIFKAISDIQKTINSLVLGFPETQGGFIPNTEANLEYMSVIYNDMLKLANSQGYTDAVTYAIQQEGEVVKQVKQALQKGGIAVNFSPVTQASFNLFQKQKYDYLMNLSARAINAVKESTLNAVLGSSDISSLINNIQLELDNKLKRYASTYLETSRGQLIQSTQDWVAEDMIAEGQQVYWEYFGPLDNDTREECVEALNKRYFTNDEKNEFMNGGIFPHTEPRWNCRHNFILITAEEYNPETELVKM